MATQAEFDDRPGPVRDAIAGAIADWHDLIKTVAAQAVELGELREDTDVGQLAFEIEALGAASSYRCGCSTRSRSARRPARRCLTGSAL